MSRFIRKRQVGVTSFLFFTVNYEAPCAWKMKKLHVDSRKGRSREGCRCCSSYDDRLMEKETRMSLPQRPSTSTSCPATAWPSSFLAVKITGLVGARYNNAVFSRWNDLVEQHLGRKGSKFSCFLRQALSYLNFFFWLIFHLFPTVSIFTAKTSAFVRKKNYVVFSAFVDSLCLKFPGTLL